MLKILDKLISNGFTKRSVVLSCGGGVIGDVTALASSLYLRGTIYYHIPTTMTAMVDSCIGGKTGINYKDIINSVGNYYHPKNVFISKYRELLMCSSGESYFNLLLKVNTRSKTFLGSLTSILLNTSLVNNSFFSLSGTNLCQKSKY